MINNKKGAALMQVLLLTVVLAGMSAVLLKASLSRTISARRTQRTISSQQLISACMAEVNTLWAQKTTKAFQQDLDSGIMYCQVRNADGSCHTPVENYQCKTITVNGIEYQVTARFSSGTITYSINSDKL